MAAIPEEEVVVRLQQAKRTHDDQTPLNLTDVFGHVLNSQAEPIPKLQHFRSTVLTEIKRLLQAIEKPLEPEVWNEIMNLFDTVRTPTANTLGQLKFHSQRYANLLANIDRNQPWHVPQRIIHNALDNLTIKPTSVKHFVIEALFNCNRDNIIPRSLTIAESTAINALQSPFGYFYELVKHEERNVHSLPLPLSPLKETLLQEAGIIMNVPAPAAAAQLYMDLPRKNVKKLELIISTGYDSLPIGAINAWIDTYATTLLSNPQKQAFINTMKTFIKEQRAQIKANTTNYGNATTTIIGEMHRLLFNHVLLGDILIDDHQTDPAEYFDLHAFLLKEADDMLAATIVE
jgi:hypothetical protein